MRHSVFNHFALLFAAIIFSSCSAKHYDISRAPLMTDFKGSGIVVVATKDNRPFVVNGEKLPNYMGRQYNGIGRPLPIFTRSGRTVAEDVSERVASSFMDNGFQVRTIRINHTENLDISNPKLAGLFFDKAILISMDQMRAESFREVEFEWAFSFGIYDRNRKLIAHKKNSGFEDSMLQNHFGSVSGNQGQKVIVGKLGVIFQEILSSPEIKDAIDAPSPKEMLLFAEVSKQETDSEIVSSKCDDAVILEEYLQNGQTKSFRHYSSQLVRKKVESQDCLDQLATIIWNERKNENRQIVDGLCHLCKIFFRNKYPRYKKFFRNLLTEGGTSKLRRYANKTEQYIPSSLVPQYSPEEKQEVKTEQKVVVTEKENFPEASVSNHRLSRYLLSSSQIKAMYKTAVEWNNKLEIGKGCNEATQIKPRNYIPLQTIEFSDDDQHPTTGTWIQRFTMERCGEKKVYNTLFIANLGNEPLYKAYYPGDSNTSLQLMHDAHITAIMMAYLRMKEDEKDFTCEDVELVDTALIDPPHDTIENGKTIKGLWKEEWTMQGCGKTCVVTGLFVPDGKGGTHFEFK